MFLKKAIKNIVLSSKPLSRLYLRTIKRINDSKGEDKTKTLVPINRAYGHEHWLKNYSGFTGDIKAVIEHGLFFGGCRVIVGDKENYSFKNIITYSQYRLDYLEKDFFKYKRFAIGPLIAYAPTDSEYKKELMECAKGNKKILTVFPYHSISGIAAQYDYEELIKNAKYLQKKFNLDNVYFCLAHWDVENGNGDYFVKNGYKVVTAGKDPISFLPRLRAIIESSSLTMSNGLGTSLGYCTYLGVQQIFIPQTVELNGDETSIDIEKKTREDEILEEETNLFAKTFNIDSDISISKEQFDLCDYFFGFTKVLKPNEMLNLLQKLK